MNSYNNWVAESYNKFYQFNKVMIKTVKKKKSKKKKIILNVAGTALFTTYTIHLTLMFTLDAKSNVVAQVGKKIFK